MQFDIEISVRCVADLVHICGNLVRADYVLEN